MGEVFIGKLFGAKAKKAKELHEKGYKIELSFATVEGHEVAAIYATKFTEAKPEDEE